MPKRTYKILAKSSDYGEPYNKCICVDNEYESLLIELLSTVQKQKKWDYLIRRILCSRLVPNDIYGHEGYDEETKDVFAIKFHDIDNSRVYCKEVAKDGQGLLIICSELEIRKKVTRNDSRIKSKIKIVAKYEY